MTSIQKRLVLALSVFVFLCSGCAVCIWLSGFDSKCSGLGFVSFMAFLVSTLSACVVFDGSSRSF